MDYKENRNIEPALRTLKQRIMRRIYLVFLTLGILGDRTPNKNPTRRSWRHRLSCRTPFETRAVGRTNSEAGYIRKTKHNAQKPKQNTMRWLQNYSCCNLSFLSDTS